MVELPPSALSSLVAPAELCRGSQLDGEGWELVLRGALSADITASVSASRVVAPPRDVASLSTRDLPALQQRRNSEGPTSSVADGRSGKGDV